MNDIVFMKIRQSSSDLADILAVSYTQYQRGLTHPTSSLLRKLSCLCKMLKHLPLSRILHHHKYSGRIVEPAIQSYYVWMSDHSALERLSRLP